MKADCISKLFDITHVKFIVVGNACLYNDIVFKLFLYLKPSTVVIYFITHLHLFFFTILGHKMCLLNIINHQSIHISPSTRLSILHLCIYINVKSWDSLIYIHLSISTHVYPHQHFYIYILPLSIYIYVSISTSKIYTLYNLESPYI